MCMSQAVNLGRVIGKFYFGKVGRRLCRGGRSSEAVLVVVDGAELGGQGQPGGEKLGWRNQKEPHGQAVASRMRGPVGEKRGYDRTCRKLGYLDECVSHRKALPQETCLWGLEL